MVLILLVAVIVLIIYFEIVLLKNINHLGLIEEKYRDGIECDVSSPEELKERFIKNCSGIINSVSINSVGQVEVIGNAGKYQFYIENGRMKTYLIKYGIKISKYGKMFAALTLKSKLKKADEIDAIFTKLDNSSAE